MRTRRTWFVFLLIPIGVIFRIIQIEGLRASVLHMIKEKDKEERKPTEKDREDRDLVRDKNIQRGRSRERERDREDDMSIFDETSNKVHAFAVIPNTVVLPKHLHFFEYHHHQELHDKLYKLFSQFGTVTYVNENLLLSEGISCIFSLLSLITLTYFVLV